ncbi:MAG: thioesterase family protein [Cyanobacteria bacterium P01_G01_bin.54]
MNQPRLPDTTTLVEDPALQTQAENWFEYPVRVQPHHTDYAGIVWHGTYIAWMEEARVECLRSLGIDYAELVRLGCDMPVVDLSIRYHRSLRMGAAAVINTRLLEMTGVRINWAYQIKDRVTNTLCVTAFVTLVATDRDDGKIMRRLPPDIKAALTKLV